MHYIDLFLSFVLFLLGIFSFFMDRFKKNIWVTILLLVFLPVAVITYYFPEINIVLFGSITVLNAAMYPFVKILLLLSLITFMVQRKKKQNQ